MGLVKRPLSCLHPDFVKAWHCPWITDGQKKNFKILGKRCLLLRDIGYNKSSKNYSIEDGDFYQFPVGIGRNYVFSFVGLA